MKYLQDSGKYLSVIATAFAITLLAAPAVLAQPDFEYNGIQATTINAVNGASHTTFSADLSNTTLTTANSTVNFVGTGGYDIFAIYTGASDVRGTASGSPTINNTFYIQSGTNTTSADNIFSLVSGVGSCFDLVTASNGTTTWAITGGASSTVYENSTAILGSVCGQAGMLPPSADNTTSNSASNNYFSINLGNASSVTLGTTYNATETINVIF